MTGKSEFSGNSPHNTNAAWLSKELFELEQAVVQAARNYDIWWALKESNNRKKYVETMNHYPLYFLTAIGAHFTAFVTILYRVLEKRRDTHNLPRLLKRLRKEPNYSNSRLDEFDEACENLKSAWKKVAVLRNNALSHRSVDLDVNEVFRKAELKPDDIRIMIDDLFHLVNDMGHEYEDQLRTYASHATQDAEHLLSDLMEFHIARNKQ